MSEDVGVVTDDDDNPWKPIERVPVGLIPVAAYVKYTVDADICLRVYSVEGGQVLVSFMDGAGGTKIILSYLVDGWVFTRYAMKHDLKLQPLGG